MKDKIQVQWALKNPKNYTNIPITAWLNQPKKPDALPGAAHDAPDNTPGWIQSICFQGTLFENCDHYAVIPLSDGTDPTVPYVKIVSWNDDLEDHPADKLYANEFTFYPIQPDSKLGHEGRPETWPLNTRCDVRHYTAPGRPITPPDGWEVHPYSDFIPPDDQFVRHGKWVSDLQYAEHKTNRTDKGWREWGPDGVVPPQRPLGRYKKPKGTRTYFMRDTARANGTGVSTDELALEATAGAGETVTESTSAGTEEFSFHYTVPANEPNSADWPDTGTYRVQFDVSVIDTTLTFGLGGGFVSLAGSFRREVAALTSLREVNFESTVHASPAGIKTTNLVDPTWVAGDADDRYSFRVVQRSQAAHGNETLTFTCDADSFTDGPWAADVTVQTKTGTLDALLQLQSILRTATLDAKIQKQGIVLTGTADAILQKIEIQTATLNALLKKEGVSLTSTTDAILQATLTLTGTLDAVLQGDVTVQTKTGTLDAILQSTVTLNATIDALLQQTLTLTASADAALQETGITKTGTVDALLQNVETRTATSDAILQSTIQLTASADSILQQTLQLTAAADALLQAILTKTATVDALLQETETLTTTTDAIIQKLAITVTSTLDAVLVTGGVTVRTLTGTADALLQASGLTKTAITDALLQKVETLTASADAILQGTETKTGIIDAILAKFGIIRTATIDALLQQSGIVLTALLDAVLQKTETRTGILDSILKKLGVIRTASADALLQSSGLTKTALTDALIIASGLVRQATLDAIIKIEGASIVGILDAVLVIDVEFTSGGKRILFIFSDGRTLSIDVNSRTWTINAENRILTVPLT